MSKSDKQDANKYLISSASQRYTIAKVQAMTKIQEYPSLVRNFLKFLLTFVIIGWGLLYVAGSLLLMATIRSAMLIANILNFVTHIITGGRFINEYRSYNSQDDEIDTLDGAVSKTERTSRLFTLIFGKDGLYYKAQNSDMEKKLDLFVGNHRPMVVSRFIYAKWFLDNKEEALAQNDFVNLIHLSLEKAKELVKATKQPVPIGMLARFQVTNRAFLKSILAPLTKNPIFFPFDLILRLVRLACWPVMLVAIPLTRIPEKAVEYIGRIFGTTMSLSLILLTSVVCLPLYIKDFVRLIARKIKDTKSVEEEQTQRLDVIDDSTTKMFELGIIPQVSKTENTRPALPTQQLWTRAEPKKAELLEGLDLDAFNAAVL